MMRVLWCGDSPNVSTGFSRCTRAVCDELHNSGHDVHILGINEYGDPSDYHSPVYPCVQPLDYGHNSMGIDRLPRLCDRLSPDVVCILQDPWNIPPYLDTMDNYGPVDKIGADNRYFSVGFGGYPPIVAWLAVDARNQNGSGLNKLSHVVTWTRFGRDELIKGGYVGPSSVIPLGVDRSIFYPRDKIESRRAVMHPALNIPIDAFIVGVVGRNQPRKRLDLTIRYFAHWIEEFDIDDAFLYLHVAPTGERGFDIRSLVRYYGLQKRVILAEPDIGIGVVNSAMPFVYSAFDVHLTTSQGEGWHLPTAESLACGVVSVVPGFGALGEWTENAAVKIDCTSTALNAPMNSLMYTIGGVPDERDTVHRLDALYHDENCRRELSERGLKLMSRPEFQWESVGKSFCELLEKVVPSKGNLALIEQAEREQVDVFV